MDSNKSKKSSSAPNEQTFFAQNRERGGNQLTFEQFMSDAQTYIQEDVAATLNKFHTSEEVDLYKLKTREKFASNVKGQGANAVKSYIRQARWEASMKDYDKSREVFEDALNLDPYNHDLWQIYAKMEIAHNAVDHARNIYSRATTTCPKVEKLWTEWIKLEQCVENYTNVLTIFAKCIEFQPSANLYDRYIMALVHQRKYQQCLLVYESYISTHPYPKTYQKYARFALDCGNKVDISNVISISRIHQHDNSKTSLPNSQAFITQKNDNNYETSQIVMDVLDKHDPLFQIFHEQDMENYTAKNNNIFKEYFSQNYAYDNYDDEEMSTTTTTDENINKTSTTHKNKQRLLPHMIFERALSELQLLSVLQTQSQFEDIQNSLLLKQLQHISIYDNTLLQGYNKLRGLFEHCYDNGELIKEEINNVMVKTNNANDNVITMDSLAKELQQLQRMDRPPMVIVQEIMDFFFTWVNIEEELSKRIIQQYTKKNGLNNTTSFINNYNNNVNNNFQNTLNDLNRIGAIRPRQILHFILSAAPLSYNKFTIQKLLSFEKSINGNSGVGTTNYMLDQAFLHHARLQYQEELGIAYNAMYKLAGGISPYQFFEQFSENIQKNGQVSKTRYEILCQEHFEKNKKIVCDAVIFNKDQIIEQQLQIRQYDLWLEWIQIENHNINEQVHMWNLFHPESQNTTSQIPSRQKTMLLTLTSSETYKRLYDKTVNKLSHKHKSLQSSSKNVTETIFTNVPDELSHLHIKIRWIYLNAQQLLPIKFIKKDETDEETEISNVNPLSAAYVLDKTKSAWTRFIFLYIGHAMYEEIFASSATNAMLIIQRALCIIPHLSFTFSSVWTSYALLQLRLSCQDYLYNLFSTSSSSSTKRQLKKEQVYNTALKRIEIVFGYALGQIKRRLEKERKIESTSNDVLNNNLPTHKQFQGDIKETDDDNDITKDEDFDNLIPLHLNDDTDSMFNLHVFLDYTKCESELQAFDQCRALFNEFLSLFQANFSLWTSYIVFEDNQNQMYLTQQQQLGQLTFTNKYDSPTYLLKHISTTANTLFHVALGIEDFFNYMLNQDQDNDNIYHSSSQKTKITIYHPLTFFDINHIIAQYALPKLPSLYEEITSIQEYIARNNNIPQIQPILLTNTHISNMFKLFVEFISRHVFMDTQESLKYTAEQYTERISTDENTSKLDIYNKLLTIWKSDCYNIIEPTIPFTNQSHNTLPQANIWMSAIPYVGTIFPQLLPVCQVFETWIHCNPFVLVPYILYAQYITQLAVNCPEIEIPNPPPQPTKRSQPSQNVADDGDTTTSTTNTNVLTQLEPTSKQFLDGLFSLNFSHPYPALLCKGAAIVSDTSILQSQFEANIIGNNNNSLSSQNDAIGQLFIDEEPSFALSTFPSLKLWLFAMARYIYAWIHQRIQTIIIENQRILQNIESEIDLHARQINELTLDSIELPKSNITEYDSSDDDDDDGNIKTSLVIIRERERQKLYNERIQQLASTLHAFFQRLHDCQQDLCTYKNLRVEILKIMLKFEKKHGDKSSYEYLANLQAQKSSVQLFSMKSLIDPNLPDVLTVANIPSSDKEVRRIIPSIKIWDSSTQDETKMSVLEAQMNRTSLVLKSTWKVQYVEYPDFKFPQDIQKAKESRSAFMKKLGLKKQKKKQEFEQQQQQTENVQE